MKLSNNFSLKEMVKKSDQMQRKGINNNPSEDPYEQFKIVM